MFFFKKALFIIVLVLPLYIFSAEGAEAQAQEILNISFLTASKKYDFQMETARTAAEKKQGLMFRTRLLPKRGMIFIYEKPEKVGIWMKNTIIPLDILFITCNDRIEKIVYNRQPRNIIPVFSDSKICYVVEIAGGIAKKIKLNVGNKVVIEESGVSQ